MARRPSPATVVVVVEVDDVVTGAVVVVVVDVAGPGPELRARITVEWAGTASGFLVLR
jgi:hypothetical protein